MFDKVKEIIYYIKDECKVRLRRLGLPPQAFGKNLLGRTTSGRSSLYQSTILHPDTGPPVKILHNNDLTDNERDFLSTAINDARQHAASGYEGLREQGDARVDELRSDFRSCFKFDMLEQPARYNSVVRSVGLIEKGMMSENLNIKFYRKDEKPAMDAICAQGVAEIRYASGKKPGVIISLRESALLDDMSMIIIHEIGHNAAALLDHGDKGYADFEFPEASGMQVDWTIPEGSGRDVMSPREAILNADSIAAYLTNRAQLLKAVAQRNELAVSIDESAAAKARERAARETLMKRPRDRSGVGL